MSIPENITCMDTVNNSNNTNINGQSNEAYKKLIAFDQEIASMKSKESFWKAYTMSIVLPPIGIYHFFNLFFFRKNESGQKKAAVICLILTIISLILNIWIIQSFFHQSLPGSGENLDYIKELITPENQKTLRQLMQ